jgi:hypothetical protein
MGLVWEWQMQKCQNSKSYGPPDDRSPQNGGSRR